MTSKPTINILKLNISKKPYDVMVIGEKTKEFRDCSKWIESRLFDKKGQPRKYDYIQFTNGYGRDRPSFVVNYLGFTKQKGIEKSYSNGLRVSYEECYVIEFSHCQVSFDL